MINQMDDIDRVAMYIVLCLLVAAALPGLFFALLFLLTVRAAKEYKWAVYMATIGISALDIWSLMKSNIEDIVLTYFSQLWGIYKALYYQQWPKDIDWSIFIKVGVPLGCIIGILIEIYLYTRPEWVQRRSRLMSNNGGTSYNGKALLRITKEQHPDNGTLIGINQSVKKIVIGDSELNGHCLLLGATGAGKTTTVMNFVESAAQRGIPVIYVDGKGDLGLVEKIKDIAEKNNRKFYLFTMSSIDRSMHYNPLRHGNYSELKDKLISITDWSEPHYQLMAERYLQMATKLLKMAEVDIDLVSLSSQILPNRLEVLAKNMPEDFRERVFEIIDDSKKDIGGLLNRLAVFSESEIGDLFIDTYDGQTIDLLDAVDQNAVVLFSLSSLMFSEYSRLLGRLTVIDLKTTAARLLGQNKKVFCIFDEFGVFAGPQVTDLINKSRAAGFHVILSTQELADLRVNGHGELMEQIIGNTNIKIIHRQDVPESAELLSSIIGTRDDIMTTYQVNDIGATGMGTVKEEKSFIIHPDQIKRLRVGETIMVKKFPQFEVERVKIRRV